MKITRDAMLLASAIGGGEEVDLAHLEKYWKEGSDDAMIMGLLEGNEFDLVSDKPITTLACGTLFTSSKVRKVRLPEVTRTDSPRLFYNCTRLSEVYFPKLTYLADGDSTGGMFNSCTQLQELDLPEVTYLGASAAQQCTNLRRVNLPKVATIGSSAFRGCTSLTEMVFGTDAPAITMNGSVFYGCTNLRRFVGENVTIIGGAVFDGCTSLEEVVLPNLTNITSTSAAGAFRGCISLQEISLPKMTMFMNEMFSGCSALATVDIGGLSLGYGNSCRKVFANTNLTTLVLRALSLRTIPYNDWFTDTPLARGEGTVYVPANLISAYQTATYWADLYATNPNVFQPIEGSAYDLSTQD